MLDAARAFASERWRSPHRAAAKGPAARSIVRVTSGEVDSRSLGTLPQAAVAEGCVLACATRLLDTDLTVEVPEQYELTGGKFVPENETHLVRLELLPRQWEFDPLAVKWLLEVAPPQLESGLSDLDRLTRAVQQDWGKRPVEVSLLGLRQVAETLRAPGRPGDGDHRPRAGRLHVIHIEPGDTTSPLWRGG